MREDLGEQSDKLVSFRRTPLSPIDTPSRAPKVENTDDMDKIVLKAQQSIQKVLSSPFGMAQDKHNDSIDNLKNEFMADYKKIIRQSGETFFSNEHQALSAQKQSQHKEHLAGGGALSQMVAAGKEYMSKEQAAKQSIDLRSVQIENEQLKAMIEIMKVEMEGVLQHVQDKPMSNPFSPSPQEPGRAEFEL